MRRALLHGRDNIGRVIRLVINRGAIGCEVLRPTPFVFELAVKRFPALTLFLGVEQRKFGALIHRDIRAPGNLQQAQHVLSLFLYPLIAANGGDAKHVKSVRLQENQDGLLVARARPASILINDDFEFLGGGGGCDDEQQY